MEEKIGCEVIIVGVYLIHLHLESVRNPPTAKRRYSIRNQVICAVIIRFRNNFFFNSRQRNLKTAEHIINLT